MLDSQLFILKTLARILSTRRPSPPPTLGDDHSLKLPIPITHASPSLNSAPASPLSSDSSPFQVRDPGSSLTPSTTSLRSAYMLSIDPPPLQDQTVHYVLDVVRMVQRSAFDLEGDGWVQELYTWHTAGWDPVLDAPALMRKARKKGAHGMGPVAEVQKKQSGRENKPDGVLTNDQSQNTQEGLQLQAESQHANIYAHNEAPHGEYFTSVMVLIRGWVVSLHFTLHTCSRMLTTLLYQSTQIWKPCGVPPICVQLACRV